jgi:hypothetical protein
MKRKIIIALAVALVIIQFFQIEKSSNSSNPNDVKLKYPSSSTVSDILSNACYDCHSNETIYPWYSNIQPVGWLLQAHIKEGKKHLNFSEFTNRKISYQNHKFEEIIEMVKEKEMPIPSYTWMGLHPKAKISDAQREALISWAQSNMNTLSSTYPADSLVMKRN